MNTSWRQRASCGISFLVATCLASSSSFGQTQAQLAQRSSKRVKLLTMARDEPDGLHKAALANGGIFEIGGFAPPFNTVGDLPSLTAASSVIVSAKVIESHAVLIDDGRHVETTYVVQVNHVFKGVNVASTINVEMPGGVYAFPDGSIAMQTEHTFGALHPSIEYVLFLCPGFVQPTAYRLTTAGKAVFEVAPDGNRLHSHTYAQSDDFSEEAKAGRATFVQKLEGIISSQGR